MEGMWLAGGADGLGARWAGEMARAAAGLEVGDGIAMIKEIAGKEREPNPPKARLHDLYDLETLTPRQEYLDQYRKFTKIFKNMGLDYPTWE